MPKSGYMIFNTWFCTAWPAAWPAAWSAACRALCEAFRTIPTKGGPLAPPFCICFTEVLHIMLYMLLTMLLAALLAMLGKTMY